MDNIFMSWFSPVNIIDFKSMKYGQRIKALYSGPINDFIEWIPSAMKIVTGFRAWWKTTKPTNGVFFNEFDDNLIFSWKVKFTVLYMARVCFFNGSFVCVNWNMIIWPITKLWKLGNPFIKVIYKLQAHIQPNNYEWNGKKKTINNHNK